MAYTLIAGAMLHGVDADADAFDADAADDAAAAAMLSRFSSPD